MFASQASRSRDAAGNQGPCAQANRQSGKRDKDNEMERISKRRARARGEATDEAA